MIKHIIIASLFVLGLPLNCNTAYRVEHSTDCIYLEGKNILFIGMPNIIKVTNYSGQPQNLMLKFNGRDLKPISDYTFDLRVDNPGKHKVEILDIRTSAVLYSQMLDSKYLPLPEASLNNFSHEKTEISKKILLGIDGIFAQSENWDYKMKFPIRGFSTMVFVNERKKIITSDGAKFNIEHQKIFQELAPGDHLVLFDIIVEMPIVGNQKINPLVYKIE
jgi:hypothetical protein